MTAGPSLPDTTRKGPKKADPDLSGPRAEPSPVPGPGQRAEHLDDQRFGIGTTGHRWSRLRHSLNRGASPGRCVASRACPRSDPHRDRPCPCQLRARRTGSRARLGGLLWSPPHRVGGLSLKRCFRPARRRRRRGGWASMTVTIARSAGVTLFAACGRSSEAHRVKRHCCPGARRRGRRARRGPSTTPVKGRGLGCQRAPVAAGWSHPSAGWPRPTSEAFAPGPP